MENYENGITNNEVIDVTEAVDTVADTAIVDSTMPEPEITTGNSNKGFLKGALTATGVFGVAAAVKYLIIPFAKKIIKKRKAKKEEAKENKLKETAEEIINSDFTDKIE